jgi:predicted metal-dependent phosphoesterase TrpH
MSACLYSCSFCVSNSIPNIKTFSIGDLHLHTTCSDGRNEFDVMLKQAIKMRYDFIAITDHHFDDTPVCRENIRKCKAETRLLCIPGMEVTGRVHVLAIGITHSINERLPVKQQVEEIHDQGGIAIAAHPFAQGTRFSEEELIQSGFDAVECGGINPQDWQTLIAIQKKVHLPCVYNSDAHNVFQMLTFNRCEGKISSLQDLKQAIKENRCNRRE